MDKRIRRLTIDDYESIIRVWSVAGLPFKSNGRDSREMMAAEMSLDVCAYFGLEFDSRIMGVVIAQYDGRHGWVNRLAVDPDYRGIGLAGDLIEACEKFFERYGEVVISALIEDENTPSMSCFGKAGFECYESISYWSKRPRTDL
jgi:N-acetylglutamate synthase